MEVHGRWGLAGWFFRRYLSGYRSRLTVSWRKQDLARFDPAEALPPDPLKKCYARAAESENRATAMKVETGRCEVELAGP